MKTSFPTSSVLALLALAALSIPITAKGQAAGAPPAISEAPPVSMGLWQTETSSTVTGVEGTPMAAMASAMGRAHVVQSCLTPDKWRKDIQGFNARQQHECTLSNLQQSTSEVSFDEACGANGVNSSHVDILIDSADHTHGTVVMKISNPSLPQPMTINMTMASHRVGSDCGDVKPGEGKMVK
ncbi:MAG: DUF3617 family protein [Terracidiphilus sp.]